MRARRVHREALRALRRHRGRGWLWSAGSWPRQWRGPARATQLAQSLAVWKQAFGTIRRFHAQVAGKLYGLSALVGMLDSEILRFGLRLIERSEIEAQARSVFNRAKIDDVASPFGGLGITDARPFIALEWLLAPPSGHGCICGRAVFAARCVIHAR